MTKEEALEIRKCNGRGYSTVEFIEALQMTEPEREPECCDCWHNYHCPMPQEGYDYNPDKCPYIEDFEPKKAKNEDVKEETEVKHKRTWKI